MPKRQYKGSYQKGSKAGLSNNLLGAQAEQILDSLLRDLGLREGKDYKKQLHVPYLSEDRFRKIAASYKFFGSSGASKFLWEDGGPNITEDFVFCSTLDKIPEVETIISVTQANPTKPGHSIENKLHQALGELYLHKMHNLKLRSILFVGGEDKAWATAKQFKKYGCSYALKTLECFYDYVIFALEENILSHVKKALGCSLKNAEFWRSEKEKVDQIVLTDDSDLIPNTNLRDTFMRKILFPLCDQRVSCVEGIENEIARFMATCSIKSNGEFFKKICEQNRTGIETDRGFNNPPEAAIALLLRSAGLTYQAEIEHGKKAVIIPYNLLYELGFSEMHRYTDFILTAKDGKQIYVESKSAGGGFEGGHKHITDRAREQIARSLLHRTTLNPDGTLRSNRQNYYWIFVLDADWQTPEKYPSKFIHILQMAGATCWFSAMSLVKDDYSINRNCDFIKYLEKLCE